MTRRCWIISILCNTEKIRIYSPVGDQRRINTQVKQRKYCCVCGSGHSDQLGTGLWTSRDQRWTGQQKYDKLGAKCGRTGVVDAPEVSLEQRWGAESCVSECFLLNLSITLTETTSVFQKTRRLQVTSAASEGRFQAGRLQSSHTFKKPQTVETVKATRCSKPAAKHRHSPPLFRCFLQTLPRVWP